MKRIKNTSKTPRLEWLFGGNPGAIEQQEAEGQKELVENSTQLPVKLGGYQGDARDYYIKLGIAILEDRQDDIFYRVKLPEGWKIISTDHSMWSNLIDPKGRRRAGIFYKAAFYDRSAHISFDRRYSYRPDYDKMNTENIIVSHAYDQEEIIFSTEPYELKEDEIESRYEFTDRSDRVAEGWLKLNYPKWEDPFEYWD